MSEITAMEAFHDAQRFAMGMAHSIERSFIVEPRGLNHEGVAFPMPYRVTQVCGQRELLRKLATVGEDLAMQVVHFVKDKRQSRRLYDLDRLRQKTRQGEAGNVGANVRRI